MWSLSNDSADLNRERMSISSTRKMWVVCKGCGKEVYGPPSQLTCGNKVCLCCSPVRRCSDLDCTKCPRKTVDGAKAKLEDRDIAWANSNKADPREVTIGSGVRYLWTCLVAACGHAWSAKVAGVVKETGCPKCKNKTEARVHSFLGKLAGTRSWSVLLHAGYAWAAHILQLPFDAMLRAASY